MDRIKREPSVLEGHSPVNRYELLCVERMASGMTGPDEEKMRVAFEAFDALVPNLGVYTRIFRKLRDDMFDAIYSDDLTTADKNITRIPYFTHIKKRFNQQTEKMDELEEQFDTVKKRLFEKHKQYEDLQRENDDINEEKDNLNTIIDDTRHELEKSEEEIKNLEKQLERERQGREKEVEILEGDIKNLQDTISDLKEEREFLSKYKEGYDKLYFAFLETPENLETPRKKKKAIVSTKRANITTNVQLANKLEDQIMGVLNTAVEEFDRFLEQHKDQLQTMEVHADTTEAEKEAQEIDIDRADQELEAVQDRFKNTIGDISNELLLLKQHSTMLMEQLQILEEAHPTIMQKGNKMKVVDPTVSKSGEIMLTRQVEKRVRRIQEESLKIQDTFVTKSAFLHDKTWQELHDSILSAGLGDDDDDDESDPFVPQERVFSKYAAMLYTSNNSGKSFEEFKEAKYCGSCGEKTVICPHKLPGAEKVFLLPLNCTHLKIVRPKVKINKEIIGHLLKADEEDVSFDLPSSMVLKFDGSQEPSLRGQSGTLHSPTTSRDSPSTFSESQMRYSLHSMYDDYRQRTNLERSKPRLLDEERCMSLMTQFWTYIIWQDENGKEEEIHESIVDKLYSYLEERYLVKDIMYLCTHDFITSIIEYANEDRVINLFGNILAGNIEGACFRYLLLLSDFVDAVDWKEVEDFRAFASVVYPFLGDDDLETLQMNYTSFSENKVSKQMVVNFVIHLVMKHREPRFQDMENRIMPFHDPDSKQSGMTEKDFKEAMDNLLPLTNDKLRRRLFFETEKMLRKEGKTNDVPIMRLAQIGSYLSLLNISTVVRETVSTRIQEWRARPSSSGNTRHATDHDMQLLHEEGHLITMAEVKLLSANISRRTKLRQERYEMDDGSSDY